MDSTLIQAAGIVFREGLEALLVLMALATFLVKAGQGARQNVLWLGAGVGVLASILAGWLFYRFNAGEDSPALVGFTMAAAAVLMLYLSGWMFVRQDPAVWQAALKRQMAKVVDNGSLLALAAVAFLAVFREGAETVLMLNALAAGGGVVGMLEGVVLAALALGALCVAMQRFAVRLPLRPVFLITSGFLFVMGLHMAMDAVGEFQEVNLLPATPVVDEVTLESIFVVLVLAAVALGGTWWARRRAAV